MSPRRPPRQPLKGVLSSPGEHSQTTTPPSSPSTPPGLLGLLGLSRHLTPRDVQLAGLLAEHRALTTAQITTTLFTHPGTARNRLRQLRELGFLDRFTHRTPDGARVTCWVPGLLSARYTALAAGQPPPTPRAVRALQDRILANPQLDHLLGVNQFFTDLIAHTRSHPGTRLTRWWSAERTAAAFAGRVHPDGHGLWQTERPDPGPDQGEQSSGGGDVAGFWLEFDSGSEPLGRVIAKIDAYARLQHAGGPTHPILFWLPNQRREANLHHVISAAVASAAEVPVDVIAATAVHDRGHGDPAGPVWRLLRPPHGDDSPRRLRIADLPSRPVPDGPLNPAVNPGGGPLQQ